MDTPAALFEHTWANGPGCLLMDVRLPQMSGLDVQDQLRADRVLLPIIFVAAHADVPIAVRAMKAGAVDFFTKPCRDQELLEAVRHALQKDHDRLAKLAVSASLSKHYRTLTAREREIAIEVTSGETNKAIARRLGIAEITVKIHRSSIMRKLGATSLVDLVRMIDGLRAEHNELIL